jgi:hypothetical protein
LNIEPLTNSKPLAAMMGGDVSMSNCMVNGSGTSNEVDNNGDSGAGSGEDNNEYGGRRAAKKYRVACNNRAVGLFHVYMEERGGCELVRVVQTVGEAWDFVWQECISTRQVMREGLGDDEAEKRYPHPSNFARARARGEREGVRSTFYDMPAPEMVLRGSPTYIADASDAAFFVCRDKRCNWYEYDDSAEPAIKRKHDVLD